MKAKRKNRKSVKRILSLGIAGSLAWGLCVSSYAADMQGFPGGGSSGFTLSSAKTELESGTYEDIVFEDSTDSDEVAVRAGDADGTWTSLLSDDLSESFAEYAAADSSVSESDILSYASDYQDDYDNYTTDAVLEYSSQYRQNMYNPMYYLCQDYEGYGTSVAASYWRINTGITQSDTSLTVEMNLYLALTEDIADNDSTVEDVEFATYWAQGHTTAERAPREYLLFPGYTGSLGNRSDGCLRKRDG